MHRVAAVAALTAGSFALTGCGTLGTGVVVDDNSSQIVAASAKSDCPAPKIVTEDGECREPEKLSWL